MADVAMNVDEARQEAGREILALTDRFGFDAYAAGWLHNQPTDAWRYFLVTPMLRSRGPAWVYDRLMRLFRHYPLPAGLSPLDIHVIDPEMETALFGPPVLAYDERAGAPGVSVLLSHDLRFENFVIEDGFVAFHRRLPDELRRHRRDPGAQFNRRIGELQAA
jgi:hypothetical protein